MLQMSGFEADNTLNFLAGASPQTLWSLEALTTLAVSRVKMKMSLCRSLGGPPITEPWLRQCSIHHMFTYICLQCISVIQGINWGDIEPDILQMDVFTGTKNSFALHDAIKEGSAESLFLKETRQRSMLVFLLTNIY